MIAAFLRASVWALSLSATLAFVGLGGKRALHPLELDSFEGVMMDHVVRLNQGLPIYVKPSLEFIPLGIMPGFPMAAGLFTGTFGAHFWALRLLPFLSILVVALMIVRIVRAETESWTLGMAGAGLFLAAFGVTGGQYDVGRPDSLGILLALSGLATLRFSSGALGAVAAALLLTMACFTVPASGWFAIAALAHLAIADRWRLWSFGLAVVIGCGGGGWALSQWLGPWFGLFAWEVPLGGLRFEATRVLDLLGHQIVGTFGFVTLAALLSTALPIRPWRGRSGLWIWAGCGAVGAGLTSAMGSNPSGSELIPLAVACGLVGPISLARVVNHLAAWPGSERMGRSTALHLVLALQFMPLAYRAGDLLPAPPAEAARAALVERIWSCPGKVIVPGHGFYSWSAGKGSSMHAIALDGLVRARDNSLFRRDPQFLDRLFDPLRQGQDRPTLITDDELDQSQGDARHLWISLASAYRLDKKPVQNSSSLQPVSGIRGAPALVYVPSEVEEPAMGAVAVPPGDSTSMSSHPEP